MKEHTKAYTAGLMDAEGYLLIRRTRAKDTNYVSYSAVVKFTNTDRLIMKWMVETFGGVYKREDRPNMAPIYRWFTQGAKHSAWFLSQILPYLVIKKEEANLLLEYYKMDGEFNPSKREYMVLESHKLKDRSVETDTKKFSWKPNLINAYYAGLMDGDGDILIKKRSPKSSKPEYWAAVHLYNAYLPVIKGAPLIYLGSFRERFPKIDNHSAGYVWQLNGKERIELFLLKILPYLFLKREQAKLVLNFVRMPNLKWGEAKTLEKDYREEFYQKVKILNRKPTQVFRENKIQSALISNSESASVEIPNANKT